MDHCESYTMTDEPNELESLRTELEHYRAEKEKLRDVLGQIGGRAGGKRQRVLNITFLALVCALFTVEIGLHLAGWDVGLPPALLLSVAVLLVSVKIIWMIHRQAKIDHFQFWILNSIDFQITMISRRLTSLEQSVADADRDRSAESAPTIRT